MQSIDEQLITLHSNPDQLNKTLQNLLTTELYCLGEVEPVEDEDEGEADLLITSWEDPDGNAFVPCFTTLDNMAAVLEEDSPYIVLKGGDLFTMVYEGTVIINPELESELVLSAEELRHVVQH